MNQFLDDVLRGLSASQKYLDSKYFYNEAGDSLFQALMDSPEYYLTNCERDILTNSSEEIADVILSNHQHFNLVELGAGDASKSIHLLKKLVDRKADFTYYPIDISTNVIENLAEQLPSQVPGLKMQGLAGEYFEMLKSKAIHTAAPKVLLFLGSNIGNFLPEATAEFCRRLRDEMQPGDLLLCGFDLKKDPATILAAYNDREGLTRQFNLNLLQRINDELGANFNLSRFTHYPVYDPQSGACKSFLVSKEEQEVCIGEARISFEEHETIFMEISQKYTLKEVERFAADHGFWTVRHFFDRKKWFVDTVWQAV